MAVAPSCVVLQPPGWRAFQLTGLGWAMACADTHDGWVLRLGLLRSATSRRVFVTTTTL